MQQNKDIRVFAQTWGQDSVVYMNPDAVEIYNPRVDHALREKERGRYHFISIKSVPKDLLESKKHHFIFSKQMLI